MTDRYHSLTVVLEKDGRSDDLEHLMQAILQLRGVLSVTGDVADLDTHMAEHRARSEFRKKLLEVVDKTDVGGYRLC
jgi:hypothetical protein